MKLASAVSLGLNVPAWVWSSFISRATLNGVIAL
jgi:hypothetical protein